MHSNEPYWKKLQDPRWLLKRQEILKVRGHKCELCGVTTNLTIHHGYYRPKGNPWEYENSSLWLLCWDCHKEVQTQIVRLHQIIAHIHPRKLGELQARLEDLAFEVESGITKEEFQQQLQEYEQILQEERAVEMALYAGYTVTLTSCSDLGVTQAYELESEAYREFPGITIDIIEDDIDGLAMVDGPDEKVRSGIQYWFDWRRP